MESHGVQLTEDEILILGDWLYRYNQSGNLPPPDAAEQRCLLNLEAALEPVDAAILRSDYAERLTQAKARMRPASD